MSFFQNSSRNHSPLWFCFLILALGRSVGRFYLFFRFLPSILTKNIYFTIDGVPEVMRTTLSVRKYKYFFWLHINIQSLYFRVIAILPNSLGLENIWILLWNTTNSPNPKANPTPRTIRLKVAFCTAFSHTVQIIFGGLGLIFLYKK